MMSNSRFHPRVCAGLRMERIFFMIKFRNFLITFLISLIAFGAVAYFGVQMFLGDPSLPAVNPEQSSSDLSTGTPSPESTGKSPEQTTPPSTSGSETTDDKPSAGDSFTFLLVGTDYQPSVFDDYKAEEELPETGDELLGLPDRGRQINADTLLLLRVNKQKRTFLFSSLSPQMRISTANGVYTTLSGSFRQGGIEELKKNVQTLTGLAPDYHAVISLNDCAALLDIIGDISFNVPCDMYYEDPTQDLVIDLKKGVQTLSSEQAVKMLRFDRYPTTANSRLTVAIDFMKTVLAKVTQTSFLTKAEDLYEKASELVETNFGSADLLANLELIASYKDYAKATVTYPAAKEIHNGRDYLSPDLKSALSKYAVYK